MATVPGHAPRPLTAPSTCWWAVPCHAMPRRTRGLRQRGRATAGSANPAAGRPWGNRRSLTERVCGRPHPSAEPQLLPARADDAGADGAPKV